MRIDVLIVLLILTLIVYSFFAGSIVGENNAFELLCQNGDYDFCETDF